MTPSSARRWFWWTLAGLALAFATATVALMTYGLMLSNPAQTY